MSDFYIFPERLYRTLFRTSAKGHKLIGYCWHHKKFLTIKQLRQQQCLRKHCDALERFDWHPFWRERRKRKE